MSTNPYNDDKRLLELLERWHSGDFSRANEQELQALADSDAFRREAVEGFWSMPETDHAMHLASLRERLRRRTSGGVFRVSYRRILVAAAAVTLLIFSVVWLLPNAEKSAPMAQQEAIAPPENQSIASNIPEEKVADNEMFRSGAPKPDRLDKSAQSKRAAAVMESGPAASGSAAEVASASPPLLSKEEALADQMMAAELKASEGENSSAKIEQDDEQIAAGKAAARSEAMKKAAAPAKDFQKQKAPASANASQPAGGWSNFQDYLRRNARLPEAARQNNVSGVVRLKFRLDENNQPAVFQTLRSLGYGCDEEAVRLVKAYKWQRGNDPELTIDVSFVR